MSNDLQVLFAIIGGMTILWLVLYQVYSIYERLWSLEYDMQVSLKQNSHYETEIDRLYSELASLKQVKKGKPRAKTN